MGSEEYILAHLFNAAQPQHELLSATMRDSLRGSIYLECQMNKELIQLLNNTLGIIRTRSGILYSQVDSEERIRILKMKEVEKIISPGKWLTITKGLYRGDVCLISTVHTWGVDAYVIPRFSYRREDKNQKRKATTIRPQPELFEPTRLDESLSGSIVSYHETDRYSLGSFNFDRGLLWQNFNFSCIGEDAASISWQHHTLFMLSGHPLVLDSPPPRPTEWSFTENDKVIMASSKKQGILVSIETEYAQIEFDSEGVHRLPWHNIRKYFVVGEYVQITAGRHHGKSGWVTKVEDETAWIFIDTPENKIENDKYKNNAEA